MFRYISSNDQYTSDIRNILSTLYDAMDELYMEDSTMYTELNLEEIHDSIGDKLREVAAEIDNIEWKKF